MRFPSWVAIRLYRRRFHNAVREGNCDAVRALLARGVPATLAVRGKVPALDVAIEEGRADVTRVLLDAGALAGRDDSNLVYDCIKSGQPGLLAELFQRGLTLAGSRLTGALRTAAERGDLVSMRILIDAGALSAERPDNDETPLHGAARAGQLEAVKLLLDNGADVDARDRKKETALMIAADSVNFKADIVKELLRRNADVNAVNERGHTVITERIAFGDEQSLRRLFSTGIDRNGTDHKGRTPLHFAIESKKTWAVEMLLATGADPSIEDGRGRDALALARDTGQSGLVRTILRADPAVKELQYNGPRDENSRRVYVWLQRHRGEPLEIELRLGHGVHRTFPWTIDYGGPELQFRGDEPFLEWNWDGCKPSVPFRTWSEVEEAADRLVFKLGYKAAYEERSGDVAGLKSAASAAEADYWETYAVTVAKRALEFS